MCIGRNGCFRCCFIVFLLSSSIALGQESKSAVFVALSSNLTEGANPVIFDHEGLDVGGSFDQKEGKFYAGNDGFYWVSVSVGSLPSIANWFRVHKETAAYIAASQELLDKETFNGVDTRSREFIFPMKRLQSLSTSLPYGAMFSDRGYQTSFSIFGLSGMMKENIYFCATRPTSYSGRQGQIFQFTEVLVNEGGGFNAETSTFTVPKEGLYFLSFGTATGYYDYAGYRSSLKRNAARLGKILSNNHGETNSFSRAGLYSLLKGDSIYVTLDGTNTSKAFSNGLSRYPYFAGFLYEPITGQKAWSVTRSTSWTADTDLSPVTFDNIIINVGGHWNGDYHQFVVPVTGIYYITFTVGAFPRKQLHLSLMVDDKMEASIVRTSTSIHVFGTESRSRSILLHLAAKSRVYLKAKAGTSFFSDRDMHTSFTGLLLFPHNKPKCGAKCNKSV